ncbi:MAG: sulfatase-like hydrolase/transferase [Myxococcota bacterium]
MCPGRNSYALRGVPAVARATPGAYTGSGMTRHARRWSRGFRRRARPILLVFASGMAGLMGCGERSEEVSSPDTIERPEFVMDLLANAQAPHSPNPAADPLPNWRQPRLLAEATIPPGSRIWLDGRLSRSDDADPRLIGPAQYTLRIDGEAVYSRELEASGRHAGFEEWVDLSRFAGRDVQLELVIENHDPEKANAYWGHARLDRFDSVLARPAGSGPNVLIVLVDTLRADHLPVYGYPRPTAPNLGAFAREARVFDKALSAASWTQPAVASLLTGLEAPVHGAIDGAPLDRAVDTIAERFLDAGVATVGISANPIVGARDGFDQGFATFKHIPWKPAARVNRLFSDWLDDHTGVQWFAWLQYIDPHDPYEAPGPERGRFADPDYAGIFRDGAALNQMYHTQNYGLDPAHPVGPLDLKFLRDSYDEEILYWDRYFGELLEDLRERHLLDQTIVVVVSDHGEEFEDHGMYKHGHQLFSETLHVPLIIRAPDHLEPGRVETPVETRHLAELLSAWALGEEEPGREILSPSAASRIYSHTRVPLRLDRPKDRRHRVSVRDQHWKAIYSPESDRLQLFDLEADPRESEDVAAEQPELAAHYRALLRTWLETQTSNDGGEPAPELHPETIERLRELGYTR